MSYKPIVDIFKDVTDAVRLVYDPVVTGPPASGGKKPYYLYGHPLEIVNILSEKSSNNTLKFEKFPLIVLFQDFPETITLAGRDVSLNLAIITDTRQDYYAADRYTNTFKTILYPLWDLLIEYMKRNSNIDQVTFDYQKTDRLFWGKHGLYGNDGNIFNDFVDAIEIENLKLHIKEQC